MKKLVFVGAGSMAEAMISGIGASGLLPGEQIWLTNKQDTQRLQTLEQRYGVQTTYNYDELFIDADAVVLAMSAPMSRRYVYALEASASISKT